MSTVKTRPLGRRAFAAVAAAAAIGLTGLMACVTPAQAAGSYVSGMTIPGPTGWLGTWVPYTGQPNPGLCIQAGAANPSEEVAATPGQLTEQPGLTRPDNLSVNIPQMAYIMDQWMSKSNVYNDADLDTAAVAFLAHVNFESSASGPAKSQQNVNELLGLTPANIQNRAAEMVAAAKAAGVVGWEPGAATGDGMRFGTVDTIGVLNASGQYIAGKPFTITLSGPAVFDDNGNGVVDPGEDNVYTGTTAANVINGIKWVSTGNGNASFKVKYDDLGAEGLNTMAPGGGRQTVIYDDYGAKSETVNGPTWKVIFDFQPIGTSNVADSKVVDGPGATISDTFEAKADPNYGDGKWVQIDGAYVPVKYHWAAYYTGQTPAATSPTVPAGAQLIAEGDVIANGPGQVQAPKVEGVDPNFVTWVWKVDKNNQGTIGGLSITELVHDNWSDHYGLENETTSARYPGKLNSSIQVEIADSGKTVYLSDTVRVEDFPDSHPTWGGSHGFKADTKEFTQKLLHFPEGVEVTDENIAQATQVGKTMTIELGGRLSSNPGFSNGVYKLTDTSWKANESDSGTWVFQTEFKGDDRVKPVLTSVEDTSEQYTKDQGTPPELKTTATDGQGNKILPIKKDVTLVDTVCYDKLKVGKEYDLSGKLMDKATNAPLLIDGKEVTATKKFTPTQAKGCEDVTFTFSSVTLQGKETVVFEDLYHEGQKVAVHADINDEGQTVTFPKLGTTATDAKDGDKIITTEKQAKINDKVCYENLNIGKSYELKGKLMDKETNKPLIVGGKEVTATKKFTPTAANGCETVTFTFDGSVLAKKRVVVFEDAYQDGKLFVSHADINDEGQTVTFENSDNDGGGAAKAQASIPKTGFAGFSAAFAALALIGTGGGIVLHQRRKL